MFGLDAVAWRRGFPSPFTLQHRTDAANKRITVDGWYKIISVCSTNAHITKCVRWCQRWETFRRCGSFSWHDGPQRAIHARRRWCRWVSSSHPRLFKGWSSRACLCVRALRTGPAGCLFFHALGRDAQLLSSSAAVEIYVKQAHVLFSRTHGFTSTSTLTVMQSVILFIAFDGLRVWCY